MMLSLLFYVVNVFDVAVCVTAAVVFATAAL